ncbi:UNKNOWN [Stylonychia lemnae]|uniref:Uncharacterized protein n=1 Tax=Stylonychia lemnae TaxID=5949 RepID=A0A078ACA5_STYLE|nr:UNKNOWN [Stylonychia lemnae]|eukprot:CDW78443.1 UNKNOWN [Stylonychia lemnae]
MKTTINSKKPSLNLSFDLNNISNQSSKQNKINLQQLKRATENINNARISNKDKFLRQTYQTQIKEEDSTTDQDQNQPTDTDRLRFFSQKKELLLKMQKEEENRNAQTLKQNKLKSKVIGKKNDIQLIEIKDKSEQLIQEQVLNDFSDNITEAPGLMNYLEPVSQNILRIKSSHRLIASFDQQIKEHSYKNQVSTWKNDYVHYPPVKIVKQFMEMEEKVLLQFPKKQIQSPRPQTKDINLIYEDLREKRLKMFKVLDQKYNNDFGIFKNRQQSIQDELNQSILMQESQLGLNKPSISRDITPHEFNVGSSFNKTPDYRNSQQVFEDDKFEKASFGKFVSIKKSRASSFGMRTIDNNSIIKKEQIINHEDFSDNNVLADQENLSATDKNIMKGSPRKQRAQTANRHSRIQRGIRINKMKQGRNLQNCLPSLMTKITVDESIVDSTQNTTNNLGTRKFTNLKMADYFKNDDLTTAPSQNFQSFHHN